MEKRNKIIVYSVLSFGFILNLIATILLILAFVVAKNDGQINGPLIGIGMGTYAFALVSILVGLIYKIKFDR